MFRELTRMKQKLSREESISILQQQPRGVLSLLGDNGYPYGMPLNHYYEDGYLYFHGGRSGHKIEALKKDCRASYCVYDEGYRNEGEWHLNIKSVIVFGTIREVDDPELILRICRELSYKFTSDNDYIEGEISNSGKVVMVHELTIEHITGKTIREA